MPFTQEPDVVVHPVSNVIKTSILGAFTFLAALAIRDVFIKTMEAVLPAESSDRLVFVYFYAAIVIFFTVLLAFLWKRSGDPE